MVYIYLSLLHLVGSLTTHTYTPGERVTRGGSWCLEVDAARASFRGRGEPGLRIMSLGIRVAERVGSERPER